MEGIKDIYFKMIQGKVAPETLEWMPESKQRDEGLVFQFVPSEGERINVELSKGIGEKLATLYGVTVQELNDVAKQVKARGVDDRNQEATAKTALLRNAITDKDIVLLVDEKGSLRNVVSTKHKQVSLVGVSDTINTVAMQRGYTLKSVIDRGNTFEITYSAPKILSEMTSLVKVYLGKNDAMGKSGVHFEGGGNITVCANIIVAHVENQFRGQLEMPITHVKIVHLQNIDERIAELVNSFEKIENLNEQINKLLVSAKNKLMSRSEQVYAIDLLRAKYGISEKVYELLKAHLDLETETLYGLSQTLTFVGTHEAKTKDGETNYGVQNQLCRLGGQILILGPKLVDALRKDEKVLKVQARA